MPWYNLLRPPEIVEENDVFVCGSYPGKSRGSRIAEGAVNVVEWV
jgi:hypothetical protein